MPTLTTDRRLTDCRPLLADQAAARRHLAEEGYLYLPGLLDPDKVRVVTTEARAILAAAGWTDAAGEATPASAHTLGDPGIWDVYTGLLSLESFNALAHDPRILGTLRMLGDETVYPHPNKIFRAVVPVELDPDSSTLPHQDIRYTQGSAETFTVWVPLMDVPAHQGGLSVLPGSQHLGVRKSRGGSGGSKCAASDVWETEEDWFTTDYAVGDALIFQARLMHRSNPNRTRSIRLSADYRYVSQHASIGAGQLLPAFYPKVPGWDRLSASWQDKRWCEAPAGVPVDDPLSPSRDIPLTPAELAARQQSPAWRRAEAADR